MWSIPWDCCDVLCRRIARNRLLLSASARLRIGKMFGRGPNLQYLPAHPHSNASSQLSQRKKMKNILAPHQSDLNHSMQILWNLFVVVVNFGSVFARKYLFFHHSIPVTVPPPFYKLGALPRRGLQAQFFYGFLNQLISRCIPNMMIRLIEKTYIGRVSARSKAGSTFFILKRIGWWGKFSKSSKNRVTYVLLLSFV